MTISLDSTVLIDLMNGRSERVRSLYRRLRSQGGDWRICVIALHEVLLGGAIRGRLEADMSLLEDLFGEDAVAAFTHVHAGESARLRAELRRQGTPVEGYDVLIAGQARAEGWAVATANLKHFNCMPNLIVEDWSA